MNNKVAITLGTLAQTMQTLLSAFAAKDDLLAALDVAFDGSVDRVAAQEFRDDWLNEQGFETLHLAHVGYAQG